MTKLKPEIPPTYAVQVRAARKQAGLSQRQLGKLVGCNQPTVANIEAGRHTPSDALLTLMRKILGLDDNRGVDFLSERQRYLETRPNKRISVMVTDNRRWPLRKVRASVASVVTGNNKTFEELLALGGDESAMDDLFDELCAHTEEFLSSVAQVSGWSRQDLSVQAEDLVAHSRAVALTPVNEEPPSEPIWVPVEVSGGCEAPLVDEVWEAPVYTPYQPKEIPAPTESGPTESGVQVRLRAVVMSTENSVTFDLCYRRKLEEMGVEIVRVINPDRVIEGNISEADAVIVLRVRLSHSKYHAIQTLARNNSKRVIAIGSKSSSWPVAFGMMSLPVYRGPMTPFPTFPSIVLVDRRPELFAVKEVVAHEKLHGSNFRVHFPLGMTKLDEVRYGSRETEYGVDESFSLGNVVNWWKEHATLLGNLYEAIRSYGFSDATLFGEAFGPGVKAKGVRYSTGTGVLFRAFNLMVAENFVPTELFNEIAAKAGLPVAPEVYRGPPSMEAFNALLEQPSTVAKENGVDSTAEGIVITSVPLLRNVFGEWLIAKHKSAKFTEVAFAPKEKEPKGVSVVDTFAATFVTEGRVTNAIGRLTDRGVVLSNTMKDMPTVLTEVVADILKEQAALWATMGSPEKQLQGAVSRLLGPIYRKMIAE